jgi:hypothetical protein
VVDNASGVAASLDRGNILSPGDAGFQVVTWIGAPTTLDGMGKAALGGVRKAVLGGMVKPGIGAPTTEGTRRQPSMVTAAIDLGLIAPVVPVIGSVGQDEERGCIGRGWSMRGSAGLVEDRRHGAGGGERRCGSGPRCPRGRPPF